MRDLITAVRVGGHEETTAKVSPTGLRTPEPGQPTPAEVERDIERSYLNLGWLTLRAFNAEPDQRCESCNGGGYELSEEPDLTQPVKLACLPCDSTGIRKAKCWTCNEVMGFADEVGDYCSADCARLMD